MASKTKVLLRNDTASPTTLGTLTFNPSQSHVIWDTDESAPTALANFAQLLVDYNLSVTSIQSGNLVWNQGGVDQSPEIGLLEFGPIITEYEAYQATKLGMQTIPGNTGIPQQQGGILFQGAETFERLGPGSAGQALLSQGPGGEQRH